MKHAHNYIDMTGKKFGRLTVVSYAGKIKNTVVWNCICDCGNEKSIRGTSLRNGDTKSCGCLHSEIIKKVWIGRKHSEESKKKISDNHARITGVNHHNWNPNLNDEERINNRDYSKYYEWREVVYERDNYTCQICGDNTGGNLVAHHLESYHDNKEFRTELDNGLTLCEVCHENFHHQFGYGNNTKEQFKEFKDAIR